MLVDKKPLSMERCEFCRSFKRSDFWGRCMNKMSGKAGYRAGEDKLTIQDGCHAFEGTP